MTGVTRAWVVAVLAGASVAAGQSTRTQDLATGSILVASRSLGDPNFAETAIVLVHYKADGVVGLILNRRTNIPLSRVFEDRKEAKGRSDPVYIGGPVEKAVALALLRSSAKPEDGEQVVGDVWLVSTKTMLAKTLAAGTDSNSFRVYMGYSGWTRSQLKMEIELGAWFIFRGDPALVFDPDPGGLWPKLIRKTEERIAFNLRPSR